MKKSLLAISIIIIGISCKKSPQVFPCNYNLIINGLTEGFCLEENFEFSSQLTTSDSLYIQFSSTQEHPGWSSQNYLGFSLAVALTPPTANDSESQFLFLHETSEFMAPETLHNLNIHEIGGFALEIIDRDGEYYSSEFGNQADGAQIKIERAVLSLNGESIPFGSTLALAFTSTAPITVWNADNSKNINIDLDDSKGIFIDLDQFN